MNADTNEATVGMRFAYRRLLTPQMGLMAAGIVLFFVVQYALLGPLGTSETMTWIERLGYWAIVTALEFPVSYASIVLTFYITRNRCHAEICAALFVTALILAASSTAIVATTHGLFNLGTVSLAESYALSVVDLVFAIALIYHVLRIPVARQRARAPDDASFTSADAGADPANPATSGARAAAGFVSPTPAVAASSEDGEPSEPAASRFFDRLPDEIGRDIIFLSAAAHYVDVVTSAGSASILLRFSDAVSELGGLGIRVHRSHWVAYQHIKHAARRDGRTVLRLTGDHEVRVGRNYLPEVRAAVPKAWVRARRRVVHSPASTSGTPS